MAKFFNRHNYEDIEKKETEWNMEDARHRSVDFFLKICELNLLNWNLDEAYWALREVKIMIFPKFEEKEIIEVNNRLNKLEEIRQDWLLKKITDGKFRLELEKFYELLNNLMVVHNMYFREKVSFLGL